LLVHLKNAIVAPSAYDFVISQDSFWLVK